MPPSSPEFGSEPEASSSDSRPKSASQRETPTPNGDQPAPDKQEPKHESRYERTKRQRAELQRRETALQQREEQLARIERERSAPKKPEYTLAELKQYRDAWENEGKIDLVEKADLEIKRLEALEQQETQTQSFQNEWHQAEAELAQADPEFGANKGTRLDKQLRAIMGGPDGQIYRQHPRGIVAAYHRARMELLEGDYKGAQGRIQELETELKRLTGLTSIGGGAPGRVSNGNRVENIKDFSRLSSKDMAKHLRTHANKGDTPWF
jgi:DNA repair exonuclease SbcCD ATPase subunit